MPNRAWQQAGMAKAHQQCRCLLYRATMYGALHARTSMPSEYVVCNLCYGCCQAVRALLLCMPAETPRTLPVLQVLAYYGYVNLNWRTVTTAFLWGLDADRDG